MAKQAKPKFPTKTCPKCSSLIHARSKKHEACGWVMEGNGQAPAVAVKAKKPGRPKGTTSASGGISLEDIQAVKAVVNRLGAVKVRQLAEVLAK